MALVDSIVVWFVIYVLTVLMFTALNLSTSFLPLTSQGFCHSASFGKCSQFFPIGFWGFSYQDAGE